ncbi:hypothetical protein ACFWDG_17575 [Peribacillus sp. NPDC060186]
MGGYFILFKKVGFDFTVKNQTNKEITGLYLTYDHINSDIKIPPIQPGGETKLNVTPTEDFGENAMKLQYKDSKGKQHTEYVIEYFEKGYSGEGIIESINKNGEIQMKVEDTTRLY